MYCGLAMSRLGLNITEFYQLSPREFFIALKDQQDRERLALQSQIETMWITCRMEIFYAIRISPNIKRKPKKPEDVFDLSFDKKYKKLKGKQEVVKQTSEEIIAAAKGFFGTKSRRRRK